MNGGNKNTQYTKTFPIRTGVIRERERITENQHCYPSNITKNSK